MVNDVRVDEVDVLVTRDGGVPWPATSVDVGHALGALTPGCSITVRFDPATAAFA